MKRWNVAAIIASVAVTAFVGGILYHKHRIAPAVAYLSTPYAKMDSVRLDATLLKLQAVATGVASSAFYNLSIYNRYRAIWSQYGHGSPVILELGPGRNIAQGVMFVSTGAQKYYGLDIFRDPDFYRREPYEAAAALLGVTTGETFTVEGLQVKFNPNKLEYLYPRQSYDIPLADKSIDYVFSHSVFEHIVDPTRTIASIYRVLKPGAITAHQFDMRDHRDFAKPLEFLKEDKNSWSEGFSKPTAYMHTNRWRLPDFISAFETQGFKILSVDVTSKYPVTEEMKKTFQPEFQKYSLGDLSITGATIVAVKR